MTDDKSLVPKLRFPGFNGAWEQRKLGDTAVFLKGRGYSKKDLKKTGEPIILYGRLYTDYETIISSIHTYVDRKANSFFSKGGEIIVPASGETAEDIARASVIENSGIIIGGDLNVVRLRGSFVPSFIAREISNGSCQRELSQKAQGKSIVHIHPSDLQGLTLTFPGMSEQHQIDTFFKQLDDLIALYQRKLSHLEQLKKGLLQKMFPKPGESYPEIRFPGFTGAWQQRKVGEFLAESRIPGTNGATAHKLTVKLWGKGVVPKHDVHLGSAATNYFVRRAGQFMYGKLDFLHQAFGIVPGKLDGYESTQDSPAFDFLNGVNPVFFLECISRKSFYLYQGMIANGSRKAKRIHENTFLSMPLVFPSQKEQDAIANFFATFDEFITLYQHKLSHLQQLKKALLQQMFV